MRHPFGLRPLALTTSLIVLVTLVYSTSTPSRQNDRAQYGTNPNRIWFTDGTGVGDSSKSQASYTRQAQPTIDATNLDICGFAELNWWQDEQRAFRCPHQRAGPTIRRLTKHPRIVDGVPAYNNQYTSYVKLVLRNITRDEIRCGGTLIHDDLVLTVSQCLLGKTNIRATVGMFAGSYLGGARYNVSNWCYFNRTGWDQGLELAVIRLKGTVRYGVHENQTLVSPACIAPYGDWKPRQPTICSTMGRGFIDENDMTPDNLITLPVRRRCFDHQKFPKDQYAHCYVADEIGTTCKGDNGSPVVCYDRCKSDITRAFVVGAIADLNLKHECKSGQNLTTFRVAEVNDVVYKLVTAARTNNASGLGEFGICQSAR